MFLYGIHNSRMKDIYDIWLCSRQFNFSGIQLQEAITKTFNNRKMDLGKKKILIFKDTFKKDKNKNQQWNSFIQKSNLPVTPDDFTQAMDQVEIFIFPLVQACKMNNAYKSTWLAPGPWSLG